MPRVSLTRIWWSNTRVYNDLQPFSICELRSKPYQLTHIELERVEGEMRRATTSAVGTDVTANQLRCSRKRCQRCSLASSSKVKAENPRGRSSWRILS